MEKYEYIIELGKEIFVIDFVRKMEDWLIEGCQLCVWLDVLIEDGKMKFIVDFDVIIIKGIIGFFICVFDGEFFEIVV